MTDFYEANRRNWNERAGIHRRSRTYNVQAYLDDPNHLSSVVRFDQPYLGDLTGLTVVHLQCHIGTDTLSLARLGADVTGLDLSDASIAEARRLFADTGTDGRFEIASVDDAVEVLGDAYDLVYTGVGALNWLPDIDRWASIVSRLLKPGGRLYLREDHPMLWTLDDEMTDGTLQVRYPYFETAEPIAFDDAGTYTDSDSEISSTRTYAWNHGIGEILTALLDHGLTLTTFREHRGLEWRMFAHMVERDGQFWFPDAQADLVPAMYTLMAERPDARRG